MERSERRTQSTDGTDNKKPNINRAFGKYHSSYIQEMSQSTWIVQPRFPGWLCVCRQEAAACPPWQQWPVEMASMLCPHLGACTSVGEGPWLSCPGNQTQWREVCDKGKKVGDGKWTAETDVYSRLAEQKRSKNSQKWFCLRLRLVTVKTRWQMHQLSIFPSFNSVPRWFGPAAKCNISTLQITLSVKQDCHIHYHAAMSW